MGNPLAVLGVYAPWTHRFCEEIHKRLDVPRIARAMWFWNLLLCSNIIEGKCQFSSICTGPVGNILLRRRSRLRPLCCDPLITMSIMLFCFANDVSPRNRSSDVASESLIMTELPMGCIWRRWCETRGVTFNSGNKRNIMMSKFTTLAIAKTPDLQTRLL